MNEPLQLCAIRIGTDELVLDIMRVQEILPVPKVTPVPKAPALLEGVTSLRGQVVPVVDVRKLLGAKVEPSKRERLVVCRVGRRQVGLLVDGVSQVVRVTREQLKPAPVGGARHVVGMCAVGDKLLPMLDLKALLT